MPNKKLFYWGDFYEVVTPRRMREAELAVVQAAEVIDTWRQTGRKTPMSLWRELHRRMRTLQEERRKNGWEEW